MLGVNDCTLIDLDDQMIPLVSLDSVFRPTQSVEEESSSSNDDDGAMHHRREKKNKEGMDPCHHSSIKMFWMLYAMFSQSQCEPEERYDHG